MASPSARNIGFDWLRVAACLGVVLLHACIPFLKTPLPGLAWPVNDQHSPIVETIFWAIQGTIMPLFFCMSGYWASVSLQKAGANQFLKTRFTKVLFPLFIAMVLVLPIDLYVWLIGWVIEGRYGWEKLRSLKVSDADRETLFGMAHLWYLQVLFVYGILLGVWGKLCEWLQFNSNHLTAKFWSRLYLGFMLPTVIYSFFILAWEPRITLGFLHGWLPPIASMAYYFPHFLLGVLIAKSDARYLPSWDISILLLLMAIPTGYNVCYQAPEYLLGHTLPSKDNPYSRVLLVIGFYAITFTQGVMILIRKMNIAPEQKPTPLSHWISDLALSTMTIYLIHHPIVGALQIAFKQTALPPLVKVLLITLMAFSLSYGMDRGIIRRTPLGRWLKGIWNSPAKPATSNGVT